MNLVILHTEWKGVVVHKCINAMKKRMTRTRDGKAFKIWKKRF